MFTNSKTRVLFSLRDADPNSFASDGENFPGSSSLALQKLPDIGTKYEVLEIIGQGGMGVVLKTRHRSLTQTRAVKLLRSDVITIKPSVLARFRREAMIASDLSHPNIVRVFDFDATPEGVPFIVMEYLHGESLEALIEREKLISVERCGELLLGAAEALDAVHRLGVVHRDLKPANLFITEGGPVKILDFGISHIEHSQTRITQAGEILGTLLYIAPEQLQNQPATCRSDIFSLGATAMEMLLGKPIVETEDARVLMGRMLDPNPLVTHEDLKGLPEHAARAIVKALAKDPGARFDSASAFVYALLGRPFDRTQPTIECSASLTEQYLEQYASATLPPTWDTQPKKNKSPRLKKWLLSVVAVVLAGAGLSLFHPSVHSYFFGKNKSIPISVHTGKVVLQNKPSDDWTSTTAARLIAQYMDIDARAFAAVSDASKKSSAAPNQMSLTFQLEEKSNEYILELKAENAPGQNAPWSITAQGPSIETVVESATFRLAQILLEDVHPPAAFASCKKMSPETCLAEKSAEQALARGLFPRIRRLMKGPLAKSEDSFAAFAFRYIQCENVPDPSTCRRKLPLPSSDRPERAALLEIIQGEFVSAAVENKKICTLADSTDALVRAIAHRSLSFAQCEENRSSICSRNDTFLDRLLCLRQSEMEDAPAATQHYFEEFVETDMAHPMVIASFSSFLGQSDKQAAASWLKRMLRRFGPKDFGAAESMTAYHMSERNGVEALIWARRCERAGLKEGLALMLDGWLKSGTAKSTADVTSKMGSSFAAFDAAERALRSTIYPILITRSALLADTWLHANRANANSEKPVFAAERLVRAVAAEDRDICDEGPLPPFEIERNYYCREYSRLLKNAGPKRLEIKGYKARATQFFIADALLETGQKAEALRLFEQLESDPLVRSEFPVAAIAALSRLGRLAEENENIESARRYYRRFLEIWPGLDIPLHTHLLVQKRLNRLGKK